MDNHINGWDFIESSLKRRNQHQYDLAKFLKISTAAVSQVKHGTIILNLAQLSAICEFLKLSQSQCGKLFSTVLNARYHRHIASGVFDFEECRIAKFRVHCAVDKRSKD